MVRLTADEALLSLLRGVVQSVEICDASGKVLGHYTPALSADDREPADHRAKLFDLEEAERILSAERDLGRPLRDLWREVKPGRTAGE
jgi:hypothetical protein